MPYLLNTEADRQAMLAAIGAQSIDELFAPIPAELRLGRALDIPPAVGELALTLEMRKAAGKNLSPSKAVCFQGAGAYDHFIPAAVDMIAARGEFYTSYTPYQAEASQGNLQVMFEYQTLITQLTGMDVSNASLYEGATAAAEAVLMSMHATRREKRVVVAESVHPEYRQTIATYLAQLGAEIVTVPTPDGSITAETLRSAVNDQTACVLVQHPNFFGCLEQVRELAEITHQQGALFVVAVDPLSLAVLPRPSEYGADIVIAEGQGLGNPLGYGGPYLGILACREALVRRMPGRLIGETVDRNGSRCWVLTLQTREQHIRRDKATSNICTNQGLLALRSTIYLSLVGPEGLRELGELCLQKSHYAQKRLCEVAGLTPVFDRPFFKEFAVRVPGGRAAELVEELAQDGILAGVPLGRWYPQWSDVVLVAVTEKRTREEIDYFAEETHAHLASQLERVS